MKQVDNQDDWAKLYIYGNSFLIILVEVKNCLKLESSAVDKANLRGFQLPFKIDWKPSTLEHNV